MTEPLEAGEVERRLGRPVLLDRSARTATALAGVIASVAGGTAVFVTENQVGSTALLLLGGVFLLMGFTGRVPDRISRDGINYDPVDPATQAVDNILADSATPMAVREAVVIAVQEELNRRRQLAETSGPLSTSVPPQLSAKLTAFEMEARALDLLRQTQPPDGATLLLNPVIMGREFDAVLRHRSDADSERSSPMILVEVTLALRREKILRTMHGARGIGATGIIFVTSPRGGIRTSYALEWLGSVAEELGISYIAILDINRGTFFRELQEALDVAWRVVHADSPNGPPMIVRFS